MSSYVRRYYLRSLAQFVPMYIGSLPEPAKAAQDVLLFARSHVCGQLQRTNSNQINMYTHSLILIHSLTQPHLATHPALAANVL